MSEHRVQEKERGKAAVKALFICLLFLFLAACREKPWDPEVAVLVNGQPISKKALDKVLELGFNPTVTEDEAQSADLNLGQILEKLINEKLILDEAAKANLSVGDQEVKAALDSYATAWFGETPPPAELGEMKEALRKQLLLRKMTEKVMKDGLILSADRWRVFWAGWPRKHPVRFRTRLLVIPPMEKEPQIPAGYRKDLGEMTAYLMMERGLDVLVEGPIWTDDTRVTAAEAEALEEAFEKKGATRAFKQAESWMIYEPLEIDRGPDESLELLRAKAAFEELEGEKVFRDWLLRIKQEADIQINPAYLEISDVPAAGSDKI